MVSPVRWPTERDNGGPAILTNGPPNVTAYIRTHNTGLVQTLPGATGLGVGGDDAVGRACLTLDAFWRLLHVFLLDVYAERFQTGLGGIPARRWAQGLAAGVVPSLPASAEDARILLGRAPCGARVSPSRPCAIRARTWPLCRLGRRCGSSTTQRTWGLSTPSTPGRRGAGCASQPSIRDMRRASPCGRIG